MGRRSCRTAAKKRKSPNSAGSDLKQRQRHDVFDAVEEALLSVPPKEAAAVKLLEAALSSGDQVSRVLALLGDVLCQAENPQVRNLPRSAECLKQSIQLEPEGNPERFLLLAQILAADGSKALEAEQVYREGIQVLKIEAESLEGSGSPSDIQCIKRQISTAFCSIAELFLTDLCDMSEAQNQVAECLATAIQFDPSNFDALAAQATYFKTIGEIEKAIVVSMQAMDVFRSTVAAYNGSVLIRDHIDTEYDNLASLCATEVGTQTIADIPQWNSRLNFATTLVDVQLFQEARSLLEGLLSEEENSVEAWYVLGCCCFAEKNYEETTECLENAKEIISKSAESFQADTECSEYIKKWVEVLTKLENQVLSITMTS